MKKIVSLRQQFGRGPPDVAERAAASSRVRRPCAIRVFRCPQLRGQRDRRFFRRFRSARNKFVPHDRGQEPAEPNTGRDRHSTAACSAWEIVCT